MKFTSDPNKWIHSIGDAILDFFTLGQASEFGRNVSNTRQLKDSAYKVVQDISADVDKISLLENALAEKNSAMIQSILSSNPFGAAFIKRLNEYNNNKNMKDKLSKIKSKATEALNSANRRFSSIENKYNEGGFFNQAEGIKNLPDAPSTEYKTDLVDLDTQIKRNMSMSKN